MTLLAICDACGTHLPATPDRQLGVNHYCLRCGPRIVAAINLAAEVIRAEQRAAQWQEEAIQRIMQTGHENGAQPA